MNKVPWTRISLEEFVSLALLSEEDEKIIRARAAGMSHVQQCMTFNVSSATLTRKTQRMKAQYDSLVPYSDKLPLNLDF